MIFSHYSSNQSCAYVFTLVPPICTRDSPLLTTFSGPCTQVTSPPHLLAQTTSSHLKSLTFSSGNQGHLIWPQIRSDLRPAKSAEPLEGQWTEEKIFGIRLCEWQLLWGFLSDRWLPSSLPLLPFCCPFPAVPGHLDVVCLSPYRYCLAIDSPSLSPSGQKLLEVVDCLKINKVNKYLMTSWIKVLPIYWSGGQPL